MGGRSLYRAAFAAVALVAASPAYADNWELACRFDGANAPALLASYNAGDPSYALTITLSGDTELGRGQRIVVRPLMTSKSTILIGSSTGDLSVIFRVEKETLLAALEVGSGVSWDYKSYRGRCSVNRQ